ncbi:MFS transporter [Sinosporangium siamense]|uniref:MFS transporter n=1 Tax=Sinosporangium siamense TaxID=1367973 RepID=A0A919RGM1_9ACTN|nr:MFS transporter [Sinosporangium siamense]GII92024.1 MFS transporter [Sinosporangium siamense]
MTVSEVDVEVATRSTEREAGGRTAVRNEAALVGFMGVSNLADGIFKIALPYMALALTDSPALVAGVALTLTLPWLLISLHVGVLVDRLDRRRLVVVGNLTRLTAALGLLLAYALEALSLPMLYGVGLVVGVTDVLVSTAVGAIIPAAVPRRRLGRANAWIAGAETVANEFAGPALGGLLLGIGVSVALGWTAAAFVLSAALIMLVAGRFRPVPGEGESAGGKRSVLGDIKEGLLFLWRNPLLRVLNLTTAVLVGAWSAWLALLPTYATGVLSVGAEGYGLLVGAIGVGGLLGAVLVAPANRLLGMRWVLFADLVGTFLMVFVPVVVPEAWAVGAAAFLGGMGGTLWSVNARVISQTVVPDHLLGRYGAAARTVTYGALPVGTVVAGAVAEFASPSAAFALFAVGSAAVIVPFLKGVTAARLRAATAE